MYTQLTQLSLLQGMNATEVAHIQKQAFIYTTGSNVPVCLQGDMCNKLFFLLKGSIMRHTLSQNKDFEFEETLPAPWVIEPESLYGLHCVFSSDYITTESCTIMTLTKPELAILFTRNDIFRMNYLNLLSAKIQHQHNVQIHPYTSCIAERMISFINTLSCVSHGSKTLRIKMDDLAVYMNETRLKVSRLLNQWNELNLLTLQRKEIYIPRLENLTSHILSAH